MQRRRLVQQTTAWLWTISIGLASLAVLGCGAPPSATPEPTGVGAKTLRSEPPLPSKDTSQQQSPDQTKDD